MIQDDSLRKFREIIRGFSDFSVAFLPTTSETTGSKNRNAIKISKYFLKTY